MTTKAKGEVAWGCWVTWKTRGESWGVSLSNDNSPFTTVFTSRRSGIMPLVRDYRGRKQVTRAVARKVTLPVPEG